VADREGKRNLGLLLWLGAGVAILVRELGQRPRKRRWRGRVAGFVPYDFRRPTVARFRDAHWSPDDARLLNPHPFGIGWTVNLGRIARLLRLV
jgi:hypothetical protein